MVAVIFMVVAGAAIAGVVGLAVAIASREHEDVPREASVAPERDRLAVSLLVHVVTAGGVAADEAVRAVRRGAGIAAPVTQGIDVASWADKFARLATEQQRTALLESAVQLVAARSAPVPLRQYAALLDLSFGRGFHPDALARLREVYGFESIAPARDARPRHADRGAGGAPLFVRETRPRTELYGILGLTSEPSRQEIVAAYRRLVAQHHPDRFHGSSGEAQNVAAARFIEITRAYEELLAIYRD